MNLSVVIPTHERQNEILRLTSNLLVQTFSLKVIIIDTSKKVNRVLSTTKSSNLKYVYLPDNFWISYSRNLWLNEVDDDFVLFMDDDFVLNSKSRLFEFKNELQEQDYHILWWEVNNIDAENYDFHWKYKMKNQTLYHYIWLPNNNGGYDVIFNYFIGKTQKIINIWWRDNNLKFAREHDDFFINWMQTWLKVWYDRNFWIDHIHSWKKYYEEHELNNKWESIKYFCQKWWISSKVEVRLIWAWTNKYLSIYRFMWDKYIDINENELSEIYKEYWLEYLSIPFIYKHIWYE